MISDERLEKIEQLVSSSLNDQSVLQKVSNFGVSSYVSQFLQGGLGAVNARVYAVKVGIVDGRKLV